MWYDWVMNATIQKIAPGLKIYVASVVQEVLEDPDFGLELSAQAKKRLRATRKVIRGVSFSEIKKKYL